MAGDRKILTTDAINLKQKVKSEMQRRKLSGSVENYGGTQYDFSVVPSNDGPLLGEHLKKNLEPMKAVNDTDLPNYPGTLTADDIDTMETKITQWKSRSLTDRTASDCKNGCTGTCFSSCQTGCYTGCTNSCTGCGGACSYSCSGTCSGSCSGCTGCTSCTGTCNTSCTGGCKNSCTANCSWGCDSSCTGGCKYSCGNSSSGTCGNSCTRACTIDCETAGRRSVLYMDPATYIMEE